MKPRVAAGALGSGREGKRVFTVGIQLRAARHHLTGTVISVIRAGPSVIRWVGSAEPLGDCPDSTGQ